MKIRTTLYIIVTAWFLLLGTVYYSLKLDYNTQIKEVHNKIMALDSIYNKLHKSQIETLKIYDSALFIKKSDIKIDNRGYFYSKYYRKYKLKK